MTSFYSATVLGSSVYLILWLFLFYSVLGVLIEGLFFLATERTLESRVGLLYLPLRPLYGAGGVAYTLLLHEVVAHPVLVFVLGALVATVVEYVASLLTETAFHAISWDYSDKPLNLQGRVCLQYSLAWGLLALVAIYLVDLPLRRLLDAPPSRGGELLLTAAMVVVLLSAVLTCLALARTRSRVAALRAGADGGETREEHRRWQRLVDRLAPDPVLINTFPPMSLITELMELTGQERVWIRVPAARRVGEPQPGRSRSAARH
jgi:uncharacterized membrane protein